MTNPFDQVVLLGDRAGPAPLLQPVQGNDGIKRSAATMISSANGVDGGKAAGLGSGSGTVAAAQARENKRQRIDDSELFDKASRARPALPGRRCFVTVGATAGFQSLLDEVSTPGFLRALANHGYDLLDVQCGPDHAAFQERVAGLRDEDKHGISVRSFRYTDEMNDYLIACRGELDVRLAGCVISHGGQFYPRLALRPDVSSQLTFHPRHRNDWRGIGCRRPIDCRREPDVDGQSPTRAGREPRGTEPGRPRPHRVS
jgi:hypothetical protein